jgi:hypothetical protein
MGSTRQMIMSNSHEYVAPDQTTNTLLYMADQEGRLYEWSSDRKDGGGVQPFKIPDIEINEQVKLLTFNPNNL